MSELFSGSASISQPSAAAKKLNVPLPSKSVQRILVELAVGHHIALHCLERPLARPDKIRSTARARAEAFKR